MCDASNVEPTTADEALAALRVIVQKLYTIGAGGSASVLDLRVLAFDSSHAFGRRSAASEIRHLSRVRAWEKRVPGETELLTDAADLAERALAFVPESRPVGEARPPVAAVEGVVPCFSSSRYNVSSTRDGSYWSRWDLMRF